MKKEVLIVLVSVSSAAYAQQKDTTVFLQPDRVEIVSDSSVLSVKVDKQGESSEASLFHEDATLELKEHRLNLVAPFIQRKRWEMQPHTSSLIPIYEVAAGFLVPGGATKQTWSEGFVSQEIGVNLMTLMFHPWKDHRYFSFGIGFQETRFAGKDFLYTTEGDRLVKMDVPEGVSSRGAHLDFKGIRFPLSYGFELSSNHVLELTADINVEPATRSHTVAENFSFKRGSEEEYAASDYWMDWELAIGSFPSKGLDAKDTQHYRNKITSRMTGIYKILSLPFQSFCARTERAKRTKPKILYTISALPRYTIHLVRQWITCEPPFKNVPFFCQVGFKGVISQCLCAGCHHRKTLSC
jgi:hypothetical protein